MEVGHLDVKDIPKFIESVRQNMKLPDDVKCYQYIIPTRGAQHSRVECINPRLVGEDEYANIKKLVSDLEAKLLVSIENEKQS